MARRIASLATRLALGLVALTLVLTLVYSVVMPVSTPMLVRWLTGQSVTREAVPLERISPALVRAVFTAEDQKFCMHNGVDWKALTDVVEDEGGPTRGASTITMQTVKNVFLWPGRSYIRKAIEIPLSVVVDTVWGKRRTMEIYLNVAEWGEGIFGAEAAARHWFNKNAHDLRPSEAVLLATALPNPIQRNPRKPTAEMRAKAARIKAASGAMDDYIGCLKPR
ncbi:monofunctional biosynthetic peptidoglycan transglycosylase [Methylobacterium gnaphalii]|uniref:Biosynthetic peptidoglycan transglycosylase n=2 Tax=Methylobacterium gnaphalii TaxID=1010610 RepID=A0A512JQ63_9HYPH|nr:monofunctional biosynthetic peptidoglycan transglycosylase [Methylobacterium gnaphalii]GEP12089.1 monofunctional biosynthetic peptidoglycan transglycosylase [Methylobacterium gnaphalii]GLS48206.1 monofunctional biosynthetic peptidoglycan transglycosylase [Methylobacterium gnaphalii]